MLEFKRFQAFFIFDNFTVNVKLYRWKVVWGRLRWDTQRDTLCYIYQFCGFEYSRIISVRIDVCCQGNIRMPHQILRCSYINSLFLQVSTICMPQIIWDKIIRQRIRRYELISIYNLQRKRPHITARPWLIGLLSSLMLYSQQVCLD